MNIQLPTIALIYDRYKKASTSKAASVEIRITYNRKQKYISTGIRLLPSQWKKGKVVNREDAIWINQALDKLVANVQHLIYIMVEKRNIDLNNITLKSIEENKPLTFMDFCMERANIRKYGKTKDSQERYDRFLRLFQEWGKIENFNDITDTNIIMYDRYLAKRGLKPYSKWNNYHRFLNSFIMDAVDAGYLNRNPYRWLNIEKDKGSKGISKYLSPIEFSRLKTAAMPTSKLEKIRDLFVFQTYTCLSYTDLKEFDPNRIHEIKGMKVYTGNRRKTKEEFVIPLLKPALEILNKYNGKLPVISNVKYNEYLKIVAQAAKIDKPVSSHWARHTGATLLLNNGVPMGIVSKVCGHSSTRITEQIYAKLLNETIVDAIKTSHLHRQED